MFTLSTLTSFLIEKSSCKSFTPKSGVPTGDENGRSREWVHCRTGDLTCPSYPIPPSGSVSHDDCVPLRFLRLCVPFPLTVKTRDFLGYFIYTFSFKIR